MKKIILIGAGGHAKSCIDVIELQNKYKIIGLIDNKKKKKLMQYKVLGNDNVFKKLLLKEKNLNALISIGQIKSSAIREKLFNKLKKIGIKFPTLISPLAYVSKNTTIGEGTIVMHGAIINAGVSIGKNCIINSKALIEHDVHIGDHCHISTNSTVNGNVSIDSNSFVGSSATLKQGIIIGKNCFINANLYQIKNLKNNSKIL